MSNSIAPGSSADVNVRVTALTTNQNVPVTYKTIILKKNLVNGVNTLTQEMMSAQNTKYVIKYDYVLDDNITVPANCILEFDGGSLKGGKIVNGYDIVNTIIDVTKYGLKNDGVTANDNAIENLLNSFLVSNRMTNVIFYFPKGTYLFNQDSPLTKFNATWALRLQFCGDGKNITKLKLSADNEERWFYKNVSVSSKKTSGVKFENIGFITTSYTNGNGFHIESDGCEKQFTFIDCQFNLNTVMYCGGTGNADLSIFERCDFNCLHILELNNPQSVLHRFINCKLHIIYDGFIINNGGDIFLSQCNIEMHRNIGSTNFYETSDNVAYYLIRNNTNDGAGNSKFVIADSRFEFHDKSGLAYLDKIVNVSVNKCSIGHTSGNSFDSVIMKGESTLFITESSIIRNFIFNVIGNNTRDNNNTPQGCPTLVIEKTNLDIHGNTTFIKTPDSLNYRVIVKNCYGNTSGHGSTYLTSIDCDLGIGKNGYGTYMPFTEKILDAPTWSLETYNAGGSSEFYITIPHNCNYITGVYIHRKPASSASSINITNDIRLKDSNGAVTSITTTPSAPFNEELVYSYQCFIPKGNYTQIGVKKSPNIGDDNILFLFKYI